MLLRSVQPFATFESNTTIDLLVLRVGCKAIVLIIFHHERQVGLWQLDRLIVDLDDERIGLDVIDR